MLQIARNAVLGIIIILVAYFAGNGLVYKYIFAENAPIQPINFSHKIHAGNNKIPCRFCHIYAYRSKVSGVPSVQRCMGCHSVVRKDSAELRKLRTYWEEKKPIPWVKIHDLPDYIYFPHKRHIRKGVKCQECHGDIASMARVERKSRLVMGWCLMCHRTRNGPTTDCWECHI